MIDTGDTGDARTAALKGVRAMLSLREERPREGLAETPSRVVKAFLEMTTGYDQDPAKILSTTFDVKHTELIVVEGVDFVSLCEHHLLPFVGRARVGYLPGSRIVGLSKLARLVDCYARRLQVQERLTNQIATAIMEHLDAQGAGVVLRAEHSCMSCRGVGKRASMVTSSMLGSLRVDAAQRAEFLSL